MSERIWAGKRVLASADFREAIKEIAETLRAHRVEYCLVGGLAVAYHANPPVTVDIDLLVDALPDRLEVVASDLERVGWEQGVLMFPPGGPGRPKYGVAMFRKLPEAEVDLLSGGRDEFLLGAITRARPETVQPRLTIPVITAEDLIVMKALVHREKDIDDIAQLTRVLGKRIDRGHIDSWMARLRPEGRS